VLVVAVPTHRPPPVHWVFDVHAAPGFDPPWQVFCVMMLTWRTPIVKACSSLYQPMIAAVTAVKHPCGGPLTPASCSFSLNTTLVLAWLGSK
jgi:hypothetical protein